MSEYADTMSEIEEIRAYEEGRLRALHDIAIFIDYKLSHWRALNYRNQNPVVEINKEIERRIKFTKEVIKDWTYDEDGVSVSESETHDWEEE